METDQKALVSIFNKHRMHKENSSRLTRWQMRLLLFDFTVKYAPGSRMGISDYRSRDSIFEAPPAEDESELVASRSSDLL